MEATATRIFSGFVIIHICIVMILVVSSVCVRVNLFYNVHGCYKVSIVYFYLRNKNKN